MAKHIKKLPWADLVVDGGAGTITVRQRWKYKWKLTKGDVTWKPTEWTVEEKEKFHIEAVKAIKAAWSGKREFLAKGESAFAKAHEKTSFQLLFDIIKSESQSHWSVEVTKIKPGKFKISRVRWISRKIELDTEDMRLTLKKTITSPEKRYFQKGIAHEFGHAIGNTIVLERGDEYGEDKPHSKDYGSIMNSGMILRDRHFRTIDEKLDDVIAGTEFVLKSSA